MKAIRESTFCILNSENQVVVLVLKQNLKKLYEQGRCFIFCNYAISGFGTIKHKWKSIQYKSLKYELKKTLRNVYIYSAKELAFTK